ncbi:MAG: DUF4337 domain-containing protein [Acidobacteria bacterium]|nr:DUF4337 domain-containing protein [Acidobacteriota bacterium]
MAELEIHNEAEHAPDPTGKRVGLLAALLAVALAVVTIASHRTHTAAIMHKASANDSWQYYQSTRVKYHNLELGRDLLTAVGQKSAATEKLVATYAAQLPRYEERAKIIQEQARRADEAAEAAEHRLWMWFALRYDLGEGFLEIALVLSSLYFISRKMLFPAMGIVAGICGVLFALAGLVA